MFEQYGLQLALAAAVLAILYGVWSALWIIKQPAGNERMQQIAAAIQEGAGAYLRRQYVTIAIVGVILFLIIGLLLGYYNKWAQSGLPGAPKYRKISGVGPVEQVRDAAFAALSE